MGVRWVIKEIELVCDWECGYGNGSRVYYLEVFVVVENMGIGYK